LLAALSLIALASCHRTDAPGEAPTGVKVAPGDGVVVLSWDVLPDLTYWIFFSAGTSVGVGNPGTVAIRRVLSPNVVGGLANDAPFAFIMNATHDDSPAGPNSFPIVQKPRLAGDTDSWTSGPAVVAPPPAPPAPPQNLKSAAFSGSRFVVVGEAATVFAGDFNYTHGLPQSPGVPVTESPGVTTWLPPVAPFPLAPTVNLSSVIFNGTFFALGTDSASSASSPVISSGDGVNWISAAAVPAGGMNAIGFGASLTLPLTWVAVGDQGRIFTTNDPTATSDPAAMPWTERTSGTTKALNSIAFLNGKFIATGAGGTLLTSSDGITWDPPLDAKTNNTLRGVTFTPLGSGDQYVAVGDAGTIRTSLNGFDWNVRTLPASIPPAPVPDLRSVTVGGASGTRFLAVGSGGAVAFSNDGLTWSNASAGSAPLMKVVAVPSMYLAVGDAGANAVSR
jgi:hypothetical protein